MAAPAPDRIRVVDTSAVLAGRPLGPPERLYAPPSVGEELAPGGPTGRAWTYLREAGLTTRAPSPQALARVNEAAMRTGDIARLSSTDVDVLALALDLDAEVVTDDYSIQNVARVLNVPCATAGTQHGITQVVTWRYRCTGCKREFEQAMQDCSVCGSPVRQARVRRGA